MNERDFLALHNRIQEAEEVVKLVFDAVKKHGSTTNDTEQNLKKVDSILADVAKRVTVLETDKTSKENSASILAIKKSLREIQTDLEKVKIIKGDKGDKGDKGKDGEITITDGKLSKTFTGKVTIKADKGRDGYTPVKGVDYFDGKDGSPDSADQIAEKLNSKESVLKVQTIIGWRELINKAAQNTVVQSVGSAFTRILSNGVVAKESSSQIDFGNNLTVTPTQNGVRVDATGGGSSYTFQNGVVESGGTVELGGNGALTSLNINGTNGNGHIHLKHQASDPTSQASSSTIFADSNGNLAWLNNGLSKITIDGDGVTANRSYTLPDASGTVALTSDISTAVANLVDTAPSTLDTLNELAAALGDDPNFATTVTTSLSNKVDKVAGKGLSTEDYTSAEKTKLAGIAAGAEVNVNADWNAVSGDAQILNKPTIPTQYTDELAQDAVGGILTDSSEIDFTYNDVTPSITASIVAGSIDETKLDASVNASLDLADTAVQPAGLTNYFNKTVDDTDDITVGATNKFATAAEKTKLGFISVTQAVDLDTLESDTATNNAKVTNATHTGEVTGSTALTITADAVTNTKLANMAVNTIKGRATAGTGDPEDLTATQVRTILNVADGANNYVHPNHTGDVTSTGDGATVIANNAVSLAKMADVATGTVFYRKTAGTGDPETQTLATLKTDLGLTGTNSGDQTSIVGITGTKAQFNTAVTDGDIMYVGDAPTAHTHTSADITDFNSATRAQVEAELVAGTNITITPSGTGATRQLTIAATGGGGSYTDEQAQDAVGSILTASTTITPTYDDVTPTISFEVQANTSVQNVLVKENGGVALSSAEALDFSSTDGITSSVQNTANEAIVQFNLVNSMGTVNHGATASTARPNGHTAITWIGSVEPTNAIDGDVWYQT